MANKGVSIIVEELRLNLVKAVNESGLPISVSKLVFGEVFSILNDSYRTELEKQNKEYEEAVKKENEAV